MAGGLACRCPAGLDELARGLAEPAVRGVSLGSCCRKMGREGGQGEVGLVIGDEYFAIRDFAEE